MAVFLHCIGLSLALSVALISISPLDVVAQRQGDPKCFPGGIAWPDESHAGQVPVVLPDRRVKGAIPAELSTKVLNDEGATYYWYFRLINQLQAWSPCPLEGKSSDITPNGWSILKVVKIKGIYANKPAQLPVTLALQQKGPYTGSAGCSIWAATKKTKSGSKPPGSIPGQDHLVIVSRGAYFASDNGYISSSKLVTNPSYSSGLMHQGAMNASSQLWDNGLKSLLDDLVVTGCVRHVTFSGHSFGAGGSMLLSVRAAKYLNTKFKQMGRKPPVVTAVMFGISTMGDETFAKDFNKYVNARQVTYPYDPFTFIFQLWTPDNSPPSGLYASVGGVVTLNADAMPFQKQVWEKTGDYLTQLMDPSMQIKLTGAGGSAVSKRDAWLSAVHSCSYLCGTSKYAKSAANWCLLHSERGKSGVNASYCFQGYLGMPGQYPTKPQFP